MAEIFISYKKERRSHAQRLALILEARGFTVWWDYSLAVGEGFREQIEKELKTAKAVIVLWCTGAVQSKFVRSEASRAEKANKLIQCYLENVQAPLGMDEAQGQSLVDWQGGPEDSKLLKLIAGVETLVGHPAQPAPNLMEALSAFLPSLPRLVPIVTVTDDERAPARNDTERARTNDHEAVFFQACKTAGDFDAYLGQHPDGHFAELARSRIRALDAEWIAQLGLTSRDWDLLSMEEIVQQLSGRASRADLLPLAKRMNAEAITLIAMRLDDAGDFAEAAAQYQLAAEAGFARAQFNLGVLHYFGDGVTQDYEKARYWLEQAAEQEQVKAFLLLGEMHEFGLGVESDLDKAARYYRRALNGGLVDATGRLASLAAKLS